jgi:integrase
MSREMRGSGTVYKRGNVWWIQYCHRGEPKRESSHKPDRKDALKLLKKRIGESASGRVLGSVAEKITLDEMAKALLTDYRLHGNRSVSTAEYFIKNLLDHFGKEARALDITSDKIGEYIEARQAVMITKREDQDASPQNDGKGKKVEGEKVRRFSNASINRETACLRHMFNLMAQAKRLSRDDVPSVPRLEEAQARQGFLDPPEFAVLQKALPAYLQNPVHFLYLTGWRKGAMRSLEWARDIELERDDGGTITGGTITLQPLYSKNKHPWKIAISGDLVEVIRRAWAVSDAECPYVFQNDGAPIGDFRKSWDKARKAAGFPWLFIHDMRRSCARNLSRAGVPDQVSMRITGHITQSMFDRYNVTDDHEVEEAIINVSEYIAKKAAKPPTVVPMERKSA